MTAPWYVIGLDIGGTKTAGGLVQFPGGTLVFKRVIPTRPSRPGTEVLDEIIAFTAALRDEAVRCNCDPVGVAAGVAETVDPAGNVTSSQTIAWSGLPVQGRLAAIAPAIVESDVRAAAIGESVFGAGKPFRLFLYVTVGTGISYCMVHDGHAFAGARGNALVFASTPLTTRCTECGAELHPVLEQFASGPALVERYNRNCGTPVSRGEEVVNRAAAADDHAREVVRTAGEALGVSVAWLINSLDPEAIIIGGGLGVSGGLYWDAFMWSTREHIWAANTRDLPILPASLGTDAGVIGAAAAWVQSSDRRAGIAAQPRGK